MKKRLGIIAGILGIVLAVIGIVLKQKENTAVSVIGGADGPTSIFIAGKLNGDNFIFMIVVIENQRIIAGNAQFTGIAAGRGVGFTTGLLLLRDGLGMRETPIRPHSWH